jgi:hypothetical protein
MNQDFLDLLSALSAADARFTPGTSCRPFVSSVPRSETG